MTNSANKADFTCAYKRIYVLSMGKKYYQAEKATRRELYCPPLNSFT